jgi:hypothetical protein
LAGGSALLTLVILCGFAIAIGALTAQRIHDEFEKDVKDAADKLRADISIEPIDLGTYKIRFRPNLDTFVRGDEAAARLVGLKSGRVVRESNRAPDLGPPAARSTKWKGYRVENRIISLDPTIEPLVIQYGRSQDDIEATVYRVRLFLLGGVIGGAGLALLAGLMIAKRAMEPIAELTIAAREIERTRDPGKSLPKPGPAEDEITSSPGPSTACCTRWPPRARSRTPCSPASGSSSPTPRTSCARPDQRARQPRLPRRDARRRAGRRRRSALRSSHRMRRLVQDLLLSPAPMHAAWRRTSRSTSGRSSSRPPPSSSRSPTATT